METNLAQKAVSLAISGQWTEALNVNLEILHKNPNDLDTLNRLCRCYIELSEIKNCKKMAQKVLSIDPQNAIATRCMSKLKNIHEINKGVNEIGSPESFLEESGKTKIVNLLNLGDKTVINCLDTGEVVKISSHSHKVSIVTSDNRYIGRLPDDISARLRNLIKKGNKYTVMVKSVNPKEILIFIKEIENKTKDYSFPPERIDYVTYTPPELVHKSSNIDDLETL